MVPVVIFPKQSAPRFGPGRLVVDGLDATVCRKATFAFDPAPAQERGLQALLGACCEVYNAGLQERRDAWRRANKSVSLFDQFTQIKGLRGVRDDVLAWGIQPIRGALRRLDEAFAGFYRRIKAGQTPGYPRFKSHRRFHTVCWDEPTSWKVDTDQRRLRIQGVGTMRLPKSARRQLARLADSGGVPVTLSVTRQRAGGTSEHPKWVWRASVGFKDVAPVRVTPQLSDGLEPAGGRLVGADRGVTVTLATSQGQLHVMPGWMRNARERIVGLQQQQASTVKYSRSWRTLSTRIAREHRKVAQRTDNWARQTARDLVAGAEVVALENLHLQAMTRSAKGTIDNPGRNVAAKSGLNRARCWDGWRHGCASKRKKLDAAPGWSTPRTPPSNAPAAATPTRTSGRAETCSCASAAGIPRTQTSTPPPTSPTEAEPAKPPGDKPAHHHYHDARHAYVDDEPKQHGTG
nr:transposase [Actinopolymorpha alba]